VPGRYGTISDILLNTLIVVFALVAALLLLLTRQESVNLVTVTALTA
jgi:hypothetical protein